MQKQHVAPTIAAIVTIAVGGWLVVDNVDQRNDLDAANARIAVVTDQRNEAQAEATDLGVEVNDLNSEVAALEATAERCAVVPKIADRLFKSLNLMTDAVSASPYGTAYIVRATGHIEVATTLLDGAQSRDGELWEVCGQTGGTGV